MSKTWVLLTALLVMGGSAMAQFGGAGGGPGGGGHRNHDGNGPKREKSAKDPAAEPSRLAQINDRLADLKMRLALSSEQLGPFDQMETRIVATFLASTRQPTVTANQTALQYVQQRLSVAQNRYTLTEDMVDAVGKLYRMLTPNQQKTADQFLPLTIPMSDAPARGMSPEQFDRRPER